MTKMLELKWALANIKNQLARLEVRNLSERLIGVHCQTVVLDFYYWKVTKVVLLLAVVVSSS